MKAASGAVTKMDMQLFMQSLAVLPLHVSLWDMVITRDLGPVFLSSRFMHKCNWIELNWIELNWISCCERWKSAEVWWWNLNAPLQVTYTIKNRLKLFNNTHVFVPYISVIPFTVLSRWKLNCDRLGAEAELQLNHHPQRAESWGRWWVSPKYTDQNLSVVELF